MLDNLPSGQMLSEVQRGRMEWFEERYEVVAGFNFNSESGKLPIGVGESLVCRYCEKGSAETTFKDKAHAIPEHIGNKWLIDRRECDKCNKHFADLLEDNFAKWTQVWRSFGRIKGKKYVSILTPDGNFRMDVDASSTLKITLGQMTSDYLVNELDKTLSVSIPRQSYVPMGVFKCLVKMAMAIMPVGEEGKCGHLRNWLLEKQHTRESYVYTPLLVFRQLILGPVPNDAVSIRLLRRKSEGPQDCPYMQFGLSFSNLILQIALPMHVEDSQLLGINGGMAIEFWPHSWDAPERAALFGESEDIAIDMSGIAAIKDNCDLKFQFEKVEHTRAGG